MTSWCKIVLNKSWRFSRDRIKELLKVDNHWFGPGEVEDTIDEIPGLKRRLMISVLKQNLLIFRTPIGIGDNMSQLIIKEGNLVQQ